MGGPGVACGFRQALRVQRLREAREVISSGLLVDWGRSQQQWTIYVVLGK